MVVEAYRFLSFIVVLLKVAGILTCMLLVIHCFLRFLSGFLLRDCLSLHCLPRCDSTEKLKAILPRLEQELKDSGKFKDFYQFTFNFAKNPGQKGLGEPWNLPENILGGVVCLWTGSFTNC